MSVSAKNGSQFVRPPTAQEAVLAALRRAIASGEMPPGSPVQQVAVADAMGVSRVPVREALKILEGEGHVVYEPHRGYAVARLDARDLNEIYRLRELLETLAVQHAVGNVTPELIDRMEQYVTQMDDAIANDDAAELSDRNRRFHFVLLEASGRPRLIKSIEQLWDSSDSYRSVYFTEPENREEVQREHRQIIESVKGRATDELVKLLDQHRTRARVSVTDRLRTMV